MLAFVFSGTSRHEPKYETHQLLLSNNLLILDSLNDGNLTNLVENNMKNMKIRK